MPATTRTRPPIWFWVLSLALLLWGLGGASIYAAYFIETPEEFAESAESSANRQAYAEYVAEIPAWVIAAGVGAAAARLLGAVCLLLRRAWALPLFLLSTALFLVIMYRAFVVAHVARIMSGAHMTIEFVFVALSLFAVWFAHHGKSKGILM